MMTNLSKWMLYISSYCIVYVFLLGVSVFNGWKSVKTIESKSIAEKASLIFSENKFVWCGLVILIAFSLFMSDSLCGKGIIRELRKKWKKMLL